MKFNKKQTLLVLGQIQNEIFIMQGTPRKYEENYQFFLIKRVIEKIMQETQNKYKRKDFIKVINMKILKIVRNFFIINFFC